MPLTIPPALASLAARHRISIDLPADLFIQRCVDAISSEERNLQQIQKSVAGGIDAWAKHCPNPGLERSEKVPAFDDVAALPRSVARDENAVLDSVFPSLGFGE